MGAFGPFGPYWNTVQLGEAVRQRKRAGMPVESNLLAPILFAGEYRWPRKRWPALSVGFRPLLDSTPRGETMRRIQAIAMAMLLTGSAGACEIGPGAKCMSVNLVGADLRNADLRSASLHNADLVDADLRDANLRGAKLLSATLVNANLERADLQGANLFSANLAGANLLSANLGGADLSGADLSGAQNCPASIRDRCQ